MTWILVLVVLVVSGALITVLVNRVRFERRVAEEMRALAAVPHLGTPLSTLAELPAPVARYRQLAVGDRAPVRTLELRHSGTFCMSPTAKAVPIKGTQLFTADPPGFVWTGRIRMAPGVWIDARDMAIAGKGSMRVLLDDTVTLVDARGPQLVFAFGPDGLPRSFMAKRYTDKGELKPWGGVYRDWRTVSGMQVPFEADVTWQLESGPYTYARWQVGG